MTDSKEREEAETAFLRTRTFEELTALAHQFPIVGSDASNPDHAFNRRVNEEWQRKNAERVRAKAR